jgi:hypothetical protein
MPKRRVLLGVLFAVVGITVALALEGQEATGSKKPLTLERL